MVLIVEDNKEVQKLLGAYLLRRGHSPLAAASSREAEQALKAQPFDVVATDITLPDGNGLEVLRAANAASPKPRVVAMSGSGQFLQPEFYNALSSKSGR